MIIAELSNSRNVTAQKLAQVEFVTAAPATKTTAQRRQSYQAGFDAFCKGLSVADLTDRDEIRGWWSALDTQADSETDGYVAQEVN
jgi:hypothetical protein